MAFNYAKEKREFDREWEQNRKEYEAAGMPQTDIDALYEFDWKWFCSRRRFINHTQRLPDEAIDSNAEQSSLIRKFKTFSIYMNEEELGGRYGWVEQMEDARLRDRIRLLSQRDLELLTLIAMDGYSQTELERIGYQKQYKTSRELARIKKLLEKTK